MWSILGIRDLVGPVVGTTEVVPAGWCCGHDEGKSFLSAVFSATQGTSR